MISLKTRQEFQRVMSAGESVASRFFHSYLLENNLGEFRVGLIASKRSFPRAVDRNFVKRRSREILRLYRDVRGIDLVLIIKKPSLDIDFKTYAASFEKLKRVLSSR